MAHKTSAPGSVSGAFVDRNVGTSTPGTTLVAADTNTWQDEICNAVQGAGYSLNASDNTQLKQAIISLSHTVGEYLFSTIKRAASTLFPAIRIDTADVTIASANYPDLVTALYGESVVSQGASSFACTISGSVITFPTSTAGEKLLNGLIEDSKVHGGDAETQNFTNWRTLTVGSSNYAITAINAADRTVTVSGTPPSGSQTVYCYAYRIAGSSTSVRLYNTNGRALMAHDDGNMLAGLRRRDYGQGHKHRFSTKTGGATTGTFNYYGFNNGDPHDSNTEPPISDGSHGSPRVGDRTEARGMGAYLYIWAGRYIA